MNRNDTLRLGADSEYGYLHLCNGGIGNTYTVDIRALDAQGAYIAETSLTLGRY